MKIKISEDPTANWMNNSIQYPRLIAEMQVAGAFKRGFLMELGVEMDLNPDEIMDIVSRACDEWDEIKAQT